MIETSYDLPLGSSATFGNVRVEISGNRRYQNVIIIK